ncbi:DUF4388 domain-containing protein [Trichloromonas sp.]|uniref:DUF4388 domain-containing protein n=1 Tax=Trichloromonas sp. TaxID=3069249 RepID=UPI003D816E38
MSLVGNLEDLGLGDILQIVSLSRKSGVLALKSRNREGKVVFLHGKVIHATSSVFPENFGSLLVRRSVVDVETLKGALALQGKMADPPLLGVILAQNFGISAESVEAVAREQIERIIYSFFGWSEGSFAFELGEPDQLSVCKLNPMQRFLQQGLNTQWLAIEGSRIIDEKRHRGESLDVQTDLALLAETQMRQPPSEDVEAIPEFTGPAAYDFAADLLEEIGEQGGASAGAAGLEPGALKQLKGMVQELNSPALGGGIILLVLRFASEFMNRAVIFIVKEKEIVGLGQFGIEFDEESADARIRKMRIPVDEPSIFNEVLSEMIPKRVGLEDCRWDNYLKQSLGGEEPEEIFLGPLVSEGRVVAVLYGDNLPQKVPVGETEALEIFLTHAGLTMEKALLEQKLRKQLSN